MTDEHITLLDAETLRFDVANVPTKRKLTNPQIALCFVMAFLYAPKGLSRRAELKWLKFAVTTWTQQRPNALSAALETVSDATLERYLFIISGTDLKLSDGSYSGKTFGQHLVFNRDAASKMFSPVNLNSLANNIWIADALGILNNLEPDDTIEMPVNITKTNAFKEFWRVIGKAISNTI